MNTTTLNQTQPIPRLDLKNFFLGRKAVAAAAVSPQKHFTFQERLWYIKKFGNHCLSFSVLQPKMRYFDLPGVGFIAYMEKWGSQLVLADPICAPENYEKIMTAFLHANPKATFVQISEHIAKILNKCFGYYTTQFGVETSIDLQTWNMKGKKKQVLRTALNHARKKGIKIIENDDENRQDEITNEWLKTRKVNHKEIGFLIRPMKLSYEIGTRKFYAYEGDKLLGFIFFDPIYENDQVMSYVPNISRFSQDFHQGIFYTLMIHAIEVFKQEGIREINLGLSPLSFDEENLPQESRLFKKLLRMTYEFGNDLYNFKGINFTKSRFRGTSRKVFSAHKSNLPLRGFVTCFKISNVF